MKATRPAEWETMIPIAVVGRPKAGHPATAAAPVDVHRPVVNVVQNQ
ncbi:MAG TPA: hypothetical protein VL633_08390 [Bacteroidota bacterium]|nr:hypothetical protein [Bacteroidota bacterium]